MLVVGMHVDMSTQLEELKDEMDKKIRFLEGRISHLEDTIAVIEERVRRFEKYGDGE